MPSATGQNWEKYQKKFDDEEKEEKKIAPLSDEYVIGHPFMIREHTAPKLTSLQLIGTSKSSRPTTLPHMPTPSKTSRR